VAFHVRDASTLPATERYDVVAAFEAIHDLGRPAEALHTMGKLAKEDGAIIVMDEGVEETFTAPGPMLERLFYGCSLFWCLPQGLADEPSVGTGTIIRPAIMRRYAQEAGFTDVEVLPIEHDAWRFYRLVR